MQCGCHAPVGAYAKITAGKIKIRAFICDLQGENYIVRQTTGPAAEAETLAEQLAQDLLDAGGTEILASLEK
jgi:hydroxymethylbilane synthase